MKVPQKKLRFLIAWGRYNKGAIIEPTGIRRQNLLATVWYGRRVVEEIDDAPAVEEPAVVPPATEPQPEVDREDSPEPQPVAARRKGRTRREETGRVPEPAEQ